MAWLDNMTRAGVVSHTDVIKVHGWHYYGLFSRAHFNVETVTRCLHNPDALFNGEIFKNDATTTVGLMHLHDKIYVIKRYNLKNSWHQVKRAVQSGRAARCWRSAHRLQRCGIKTPAPVAMLEKRVGPFRRQSYYLYDYIPGPQGFAVFRDQPGSAALTQVRAEKTVALIQAMLAHHISHGDLKASNFIYAGVDPFFIDLDGMYYHRFYWLLHWRFRRRQRREIQRFMQNWENLPVEVMFRELIDTHFQSG